MRQEKDCGKLVSSQADNKLSKRCKLRDGSNSYCLLPGTYIIPLSIFFKDIKDKEKYIRENAEHYSKFYPGEKSEIFSTLNEKKEDPYELLREFKEGRTRDSERKEFRDVERQKIEMGESKAFLDFNRSFREGIRPEYVMSVMDMISYAIDGRLNLDSTFIVPGLCEGGSPSCRMQQGEVRWYEKKM